jgi:hypothetical protein
MKRIFAFVYGLACYCAFVATFLYAVGFREFPVPRNRLLESGATTGLLAIDGGLLALFALQHSGRGSTSMTRFVPNR